jgi:hypothetical protein
MDLSNLYLYIHLYLEYNTVCKYGKALENMGFSVCFGFAFVFGGPRA